MARRVISILVMLCILLGLLPGAVWAQNGEVEAAHDNGNARALTDAWFGSRVQTLAQDSMLDADLLAAVEGYFSDREQSFLGVVPEAPLMVDSPDQSFAQQVRWSQAVSDFADRASVSVLDAVTTAFTDSAEVVTREDGTLAVYIREWTFCDYDDLSDDAFASDVMGFGLYHKLTYAPSGASWVLLSDEYDATAGFNLCTMNDSTWQELAEMDYVPTEEDYFPEDSLNMTPAEPKWGYYADYDPDSASVYSDRYVYHGASGGAVYESYYNSAYANYNSVGGDCANYASQCIYAGGMPMTVGTPYLRDGWFYISGSNRSGTWTRTDFLQEWMDDHWGVLTAASDDTVFKGSPVFYRDAHTTFCVGYNSAGVPIINSHNNDWYHAPWDYWDDGAPITTVQLTPQPVLSTPEVGIPQNIAVTTSGDSVTVTFDATANAEYYDVYLVQEPWDWSDIKYGKSTTTCSASFTNVQPGGYCAFVIARPNPDIGKQSRWVYFKILPAKPDSPVVTLSAQSTFVGGNAITASWAGVAGVERYAYTLTRNGASYKTDTVSALSVTFADLPEGDYSLTVTAKDSGGKASDPSQAVSFAVYSGGYSPDRGIRLGQTQYLLYEQTLPRDASEAYCDSIGGHLAVISSAEEDAAMTELVKDGTADWYWLGASKKNGVWVWDDGTPVPMSGANSNWGSLDGAASGDYLAKKRVGGTWAGISASTESVGFLCQVDNASRLLTFDANGGYTNVTGKNVVLGEEFGTLPVPFREAHSFDGWFTEKTGGKRILETDLVDYQGDCTLYAHWTKTCGSGHSYVTEITEAPTEVLPGLLTSSCSACGSTLLTALPRLNDVNYSKTLTRAASCAQEGIVTYEWKDKSFGTLSFPVVLPRTPHSYKETVKDASCMTRGTLSETCVVCGESHVVSRSSALGHLWEGNLDSSKAESFVCLRCGKQCTCLPDNLERPDQFQDVQEKNWFYDAVLWAVWRDVTAGTSRNVFSPNSACSRAQVVTFLWRAAGEPEPKMLMNPFTDVPAAAYYYKAVLWAVEQGITTGMGNSTFSPQAPCTRGQVVTFLWRAAGMPDNHMAYCPFTDVQDSAFYYKAILWAIESGVTSGTDEGRFEPASTCTRAQVVTFLYNFAAN